MCRSTLSGNTRNTREKYKDEKQEAAKVYRTRLFSYSEEVERKTRKAEWKIKGYIFVKEKFAIQKLSTV